MTSDEKLSYVKSNLQMTTSSNDTLLSNLISMAEKQIETEGLQIEDDNLQHDILICDYACWLFRSRASDNTSISRYLRYSLNNLIFAQKSEGESG